MEHKILKTALGDIHYHTSRCDMDSLWLVFLPGLSADHTLFEKQTEYFEGRFSFMVWDAPAHGLSRPFRYEFDMSTMADFLQRIFDAENIKDFILVGQSLGGYISQVYMDRYPDKCKGFISVDSCSMSRKYYSSWELYLLKRTKWMYRCIPWKLLLKWGIWGTSTTEYGRKLMEKIWSVYDREEFCDLADFGYRIFAEAVEAKDEYLISCPVLLLCGEKDMAGSAKSYNRRWTKVDGFPLVWLKGAGHNSNTDAPDKVNRLIEDFALALR